MRLSLPNSLLRATPRKLLWLGAGGVAIFIGTIVVGYLLTPKPADSRAAVGYDFIAFYTAGRFVQDGRAAELYDLRAVSDFQHNLALQNGTRLGSAVGPFWNPPFYAWLFVPMAKLSFPTAMQVWVLINLLCAAGAVTLLWPLVANHPKEGVINGALIPVLMVLSTPFIHAISHAQNTCTSLLIMTAAVMLWRKQRALAAGIAAGFLFYKPQLAVVFSAVLVLDLGVPAILGLGITGMALLGASLALPGTLNGFLHQMPANLHFVQDQVPYLWERHVTFKAFWRLLIQGPGAGNTIPIVRALATLCSAAVGCGLAWSIVQFRKLRATGLDVPTPRDRLISATIAATPLLMPFYFDYDQLLLLVPAVLLAGEFVRNHSAAVRTASDRWLLRIWPVHYVWLMLNPDIALLTRLNLTVPLLAGVVLLLIVRAGRVECVVAEIEQREKSFALAA